MYNGERTVFGSINKKDMENLPVLIPNNKTIGQFENLVTPLDQKILVNYEETCVLQSLRNALLPRLISGALDLSAVDL